MTPIIGETKKGWEIGRVSNNKRIWLACADCGKERWVLLKGGIPISRYCGLCFFKNHNPNIGNFGSKNHRWRGGVKYQKKGRRPPAPIADRFWKKVEKTNGCWLWKGSQTEYGYGRFNISGRVEKAPRVAYKLTYGSIPEGMDILHTCDNPPCVRPDHLFPGTAKDNALDMVAKGRCNPGRANGEQIAHKLTTEQVLQIKERIRQNESLTVLAREFGVAINSISRIKRGKTWAWLK